MRERERELRARSLKLIRLELGLQLELQGLKNSGMVMWLELRWGYYSGHIWGNGAIVLFHILSGLV